MSWDLEGWTIEHKVTGEKHTLRLFRDCVIDMKYFPSEYYWIMMEMKPLGHQIIAAFEGTVYVLDKYKDRCGTHSGETNLKEIQQYLEKCRDFVDLALDPNYYITVDII